MTEVTYLKRGQRPPKGEAAVLIECGRGAESISSTAWGVTIRTSAEFLAQTIAGVREKGARIFVRGVSSAEDQYGFTRKSPRSRRASRPTVEELEREAEIDASVRDKLAALLATVSRVASDRATDLVSALRGEVDAFLAAAPADDYGQRRALEKLDEAVGRLRLLDGDPRSQEVWRVANGIILPKLFEAWKKH
jgi:hypothetical protein